MEEHAYILMFSRWLHILAAMAAIGGSTFMLLALVPSVRETVDGESRTRLHDAVRRRWARVAHSAIAILLVTGGVNFMLVGVGPQVPPMPYHAVFGVKFLLAMLVFFISSALLGRSPGLAKMRAAPRKWLAILVGGGVVIVLLSGYLSVVRRQDASAVPATNAVRE
ncbi:MAG: hypothetical protein ACE5E5_04370 [Phycisphaerae bacterium]